ncbi:MAG: hypothetical protein ACFB0C_00055 [Leptolyngbyaceae cyanobacterium]
MKFAVSSGVALLALMGAALSVSAQPADLHQASQLADLAFGYAIAEQPDKAIALLEQASTYEDDSCYEANVWLKIGAGYRTVRELEKGGTFLAKAHRIALERDLENCAGSATTPGESLLNRSLEYAEEGHIDLALHIVDQSDNFFAPIVMAQIAGEAYEAGHQRKAKQIVRRSIELTADTIAQAGDDSIFHLLPLAVLGQIQADENAQLAEFLIDEVGKSDLEQQILLSYKS